MLETARFHLHPIAADAPDHRALYIHLYTDPAVMRQILPPLVPAAAERAFERLCELSAGDDPSHRYWIIADKASGDALGLAGFRRNGGEAEIGAMLREPWWRRRVSSETFVTLIAFGFEAMELALIFAESQVERMPSIDRLLYPLGFRRTPERASAPGLCRWELPRRHWSALRANR